MSEVVILLTAFAAGVGLGTFYFGGLWLTVKRLPKVRRPALLSMCSFFGRLGIILFGFYLIMDGHWERMIVCLIGFLAMRGILVRVWGPSRGKQRAESGEKKDEHRTSNVQHRIMNEKTETEVRGRMSEVGETSNEQPATSNEQRVICI